MFCLQMKRRRLSCCWPRKKKEAKKLENGMCRRTKGGTGNLLGLKGCSNGCTVLIVEDNDGGGEALYCQVLTGTMSALARSTCTLNSMITAIFLVSCVPSVAEWESGRGRD